MLSNEKEKLNILGPWKKNLEFLTLLVQANVTEGLFFLFLLASYIATLFAFFFVNVFIR